MTRGLLNAGTIFYYYCYYYYLWVPPSYLKCPFLKNNRFADCHHYERREFRFEETKCIY